MSNPYQLDPDTLQAVQKTAQEEKLITLKDDSTKPPSTIGTSSLHGIMFGPAAGQPSSSVDDVKPSWGKQLIRILFWIWAIALLLSFLTRIFK